MLRGLASSYLAETDPKDWRASPLFGTPARLPPLLIQVGTDELLLDDARQYADRAARRGNIVEPDLFEGMHHVFQRDFGNLETAATALDRAADFVVTHWHS